MEGEEDNRYMKGERGWSCYIHDTLSIYITCVGMRGDCCNST